MGGGRLVRELAIRTDLVVPKSWGLGTFIPCGSCSGPIRWLGAVGRRPLSSCPSLPAMRTLSLAFAASLLVFAGCDASGPDGSVSAVADAKEIAGELTPIFDTPSSLGDYCVGTYLADPSPAGRQNTCKKPYESRKFLNPAGCCRRP